MAGLKLTIDGEKHEVDLDKLTAGEGYLLKTDFGLADFTDLNVYDPEQIIGFAVIALKRKHPEMDEITRREKAESVVTGPMFDALNKDMAAAMKKAEQAEKDPPRPVANASVAGEDGGSGTTRARRGQPK